MLDLNTALGDNHVQFNIIFLNYVPTKHNRMMISTTNLSNVKSDKVLTLLLRFLMVEPPLPIIAPAFCREKETGGMKTDWVIIM